LESLLMVLITDLSQSGTLTTTGTAQSRRHAGCVRSRTASKKTSESETGDCEKQPMKAQLDGAREKATRRHSTIRASTTRTHDRTPRPALAVPSRCFFFSCYCYLLRRYGCSTSCYASVSFQVNRNAGAGSPPGAPVPAPRCRQNEHCQYTLFLVVQDYAQYRACSMNFLLPAHCNPGFQISRLSRKS